VKRLPEKIHLKGKKKTQLVTEEARSWDRAMEFSIKGQ